jgi:competence protein ComEA
MKFGLRLWIVIFLSNLVLAMSLNDINDASKEDLMKIKGIGEKKAIAIMDARPFKTMAELDDVKGIGPSLLNNIKNDTYKSGVEPPQRTKKKINLFEQ